MAGTPSGLVPDPTGPTCRQRLQARIQAGRDRLETERARSVAVGFAFDAVSYDTDTGAAVLAAALGFRVFLFEVPYVGFFMIVAGYVSDVFHRESERDVSRPRDRTTDGAERGRHDHSL